MNTSICIAVAVLAVAVSGQTDCYTRCRSSRVSVSPGCEFYKIWVQCLDECLAAEPIWNLCKDRVAAFQAEYEPMLVASRKKMFSCGYQKKTPEEYGC